MTTGQYRHAVGNANAWSNAERRIIAISILTIALYMINLLVQQSIAHDGPRWQAAVYVAVTVMLFAAYGTVLLMSRRDELSGRRVRMWAIAVPCAANLLLMPWAPSMSQDMLSYMAHGFLAVVPGGNPFTQAAMAARQTAIGPELAAAGWHTEAGITPYGIVWTQIEVTIMKLCGVNIGAALILLKTVVVAASLGTAYLIWSFLGRVRPAAQLTGTLAYLWNPLIIVEFAGEGHNDAVMVFFVVAALAACASRRPVLSMVSQALAVLSKYVPILFAPAQLIYLWRARRGTRWFGLEFLAAAAATAVILAVLYASLWAGAHTFDGLLQRGLPISSASPFGAINWIVRRSPFAAAAGTITLGLVTLPVLGFVVWTSLRVTDAASLARSFAWTSLAFVLVASPDFWPWYACLPVALVAVAESDRLLWLAMLMSFTARLCAPLDVMREHELLSMQAAKGTLTGLGTTLPLIALVIWVHRRRRRPQSPSAP
jgi:alpha-1,6-mannosyltransferase